MNIRRVVIVVLAGALTILGVGCAATGAGGETPMSYDVQQAEGKVALDGNWEGRAWRDVEPITLERFMGDRPTHLPRTRAKLLYDAESIHVIFRVEDRYVRAVAQKHQDAVCLDSCVEFFFAPQEDVDDGYFNLEMNCGGTMLFHFQQIPRKGTKVAAEHLDRIDVASQLPAIIDPEITEPTTWTVQYRLPVAILEEYAGDVEKPAPGVVWRANFYKCADKCSHPHWLTWAYVDRPRPDFHVPESFGRLVFK